MKKLNIVLTDHDSKTPAGFHHDLRLQDPDNSNNYFSWAFKSLPENVNDKVGGVQTKDHTSTQAYYRSKSLKVVVKAKVSLIHKSHRSFVFVFLYGKHKGEKWVLYKFANAKKKWLLFRGKDYEGDFSKL